MSINAKKRRIKGKWPDSCQCICKKVVHMYTFFWILIWSGDTCLLCIVEGSVLFSVAPNHQVSVGERAFRQTPREALIRGLLLRLFPCYYSMGQWDRSTRAGHAFSLFMVWQNWTIVWLYEPCIRVQWSSNGPHRCSAPLISILSSVGHLSFFLEFSSNIQNLS